MSSKITIDHERTLGMIDPKLFGGFIEHMGRAIYQGIYEPDSALSDERGFRCDVLEALQALGPTVVRYPGGNFLSGYRWLDGVGPKEKRPRRRELAWRSIESNQFGVDEFMQWIGELGAEAMLGVNLGTGTIEEASALVEYCNAPEGSSYADLRARNGHPQPYGVRYWCLGNEMDGPWQIGHLDAHAYGAKALEAAKLMKLQDPQASLVLCGSSGPGMPTYPEWDRVTLETAWEQVDYLSMHYYAGNRDDDSAGYLALSHDFEAFVDTLEGTLRFVKSKLRSKHDVFLSWDEWNVWYKDQQMDGEWSEAPHLIEEVYNLEDALVVAQWLNVFLRRCYVLKMACLAQLVNVIAPILTRPDGLLKQSIYYPFQLFRRHAVGEALDVSCQSPVYETARFGATPLLDVSASRDDATGQTAVFIVNRSLEAPEPVELTWRGWQGLSRAQLYQLAGDDLKTANSFERPDRVSVKDLGTRPVGDARLELLLPPMSFTVVRAG